MADMLSNSKRKFIENWRKQVCQYMENGNICRIVVGEMTPEPIDICPHKRPSEEHTKAMMRRSPIPPLDNTPSDKDGIRFIYSHGDEVLRQTTERVKNGGRNGLQISQSHAYIQRHNHINNMETHDLRSGSMLIEETLSPVELPDLSDRRSNPLRRRSSKTAKDIYDKYNMKSENHKFPGVGGNDNAMHLYHMPWRNKTFLTLPMRFNPKKNTMGLTRQKTNMSSFNTKSDNKSKGSEEWNAIEWE